MQSGFTGINTVRIYNPIKQGLEHDAEGDFVRQWVPELRNAPTAFLHDPWMEFGMLEEKPANYPAPIIHVVTAMRIARERLHAPRKTMEFNKVNDAIQAKHGSRKAGLKQTDKIAFAKQRELSARKASREKSSAAQNDLFKTVL